jgi:hypothetical protein
MVDGMGISYGTHSGNPKRKSFPEESNASTGNGRSTTASCFNKHCPLSEQHFQHADKIADSLRAFKTETIRHAQSLEFS